MENRFSAAPARRPTTDVVAGQPVSAAEHSAFRNAQHGEARIVLITDAVIAKAQNSLPRPAVDALKNLQLSQIAQIKLKPKTPPH